MDRKLNAGELLATAREEFLAKLMPALPAELRYHALMIANAMAIAGRECHLADSVERQELDLLQALCGEPSAVREDDVAAYADALPTLRESLCTAIRGGSFDGDPQEGVLLAALEKMTRLKLEVSNPKALKSPQIAPG